MATMEISLPDPLKEWVEDRARAGSFDDTSDYMRSLIQRERERLTKIAAMQAAVDEGLASGIGTRSLREIREEARERAGIGPADLDGV